MSSYTTEHAGALEDIQDAGSPVTFSLEVKGAYTAATDSFAAPTTTEIDGHAIAVRGDPQAYRDLGLVFGAGLTLLFAPETYGELPAPLSTVEWAGSTWTVRAVDPVAPNGDAIMARVVCTR